MYNTLSTTAFNMIQPTLPKYTVALGASLPVLMAIRVLHGVAFAVSGTLSMSFATSFVPDDRIGSAVGYLGLGQAIATALAGGWLPSRRWACARFPMRMSALRPEKCGCPIWLTPAFCPTRFSRWF